MNREHPSGACRSAAKGTIVCVGPALRAGATRWHQWHRKSWLTALRNRSTGGTNSATLERQVSRRTQPSHHGFGCKLRASSCVFQQVGRAVSWSLAEMALHRSCLVDGRTPSARQREHHSTNTHVVVRAPPPTAALTHDACLDDAHGVLLRWQQVDEPYSRHAVSQ